MPAEIILEQEEEEVVLHTCDHCGNEVEEELQEIAGECVCDSCADDVHTCEHCGNEAFDCHCENGSWYCDSCYDEAHTCSRCSDLYWGDGTEIDGDYVCESCAGEANECDHCNTITFEDMVDVDGDSWCERCVERHAHYWESDGAYHTEPERTGPIYDRHEKRGEQMPDSKGGNYVGVELEIIPNEDEDRESLAEDVASHDKCHCEEDSSLDDGGFEIVTDYGNLKQVLGLLESISDTISDRAKSHCTNCCGLHVHLSKNKCSQYDIARLVVFWNSPDNRVFLKLFARRSPNRFCKVKQVSGAEASLANSKDRYEVVNVTNCHTIEIRAFRGTTRKATLLACVQLASLTWEFAKDKSVSDTELTEAKFREWIADRDAEHVINYLKEKGAWACA